MRETDYLDDDDFDPDRLMEQIIRAGDEWADTNAAASLLEESRKSVLAEIIAGYMSSEGIRSVAEAERRALQDDHYCAHTTRMVEARRVANRARVRFDARRVWCDLKRTKAANLRAQLQTL